MLGLAAALALPARGLAQGSYPDHPIKLIVPRPAGGVVDVIGREWSAKAKALGTVYIENMGGGGGTIGAASAARAPADGYTLLLGTTSELVISPMLARRRATIRSQASSRSRSSATRRRPSPCIRAFR